MTHLCVVWKPTRSPSRIDAAQSSDPANAAGYSSKFEAEQEDAYNWESEQRECNFAGHRCTAGENASDNPAKAG
jgi:hypothetical protein